MRNNEAQGVLWWVALAAALAIVTYGCATGPEPTVGTEGGPRPTATSAMPASPSATASVIATIGMVYPTDEYGRSAPVVAPPPIPDCPGAKVLEREEAGMELLVRYLTSDDPEAVYSFYRAELPKYGWDFWSANDRLYYGYNPVAGEPASGGYGRFWGHSVEVFVDTEDSETEIRIYRSVVSWKAFAAPIPVPTIPDYPGAALVPERSKTPTAVRVGGVIDSTYVTPDSPGTIIDFYMEELPKHNWSYSQVQREEPQYLYYTYGNSGVDMYYLTIRLSQEGEKTYIHVLESHQDR